MKFDIKEKSQNYVQYSYDMDSMNKIKDNFDNIAEGLVIIINTILSFFFMIFLLHILNILKKIFLTNKNSESTSKNKLFFISISLVILGIIIYYLVNFNILIDKFFDFTKGSFKEEEDIKKLENVNTNNNLLIALSIIFSILIMASVLLYFKYYKE